MFKSLIRAYNHIFNPSFKRIALSDLEESRIELMEAQAKLEYYESIVGMYTKRLIRLERIVKVDCEIRGDKL